uniref:Uncharacterized protein n=1 Tax=Chromera velia CCMP2878 TaxID=1169474 RepID=A0A0G4H4M1_9ALVE|eukprot:Cvel_851.t1-p1 / transcript=Cvel_851.t1 / gene=Cvel_851 / organism=Chromera_velia_CCMP2878 / gene_product=hypothetical protein / transcript_product=hypothetical protein / location=Cvel_scaffold26:148087-150709(+) / protein_length=234 / sequence_SO=supercontig / SO=protein_coding / is_pseudo=false
MSKYLKEPEQGFAPTVSGTDSQCLSGDASPVKQEAPDRHSFPPETDTKTSPVHAAEIFDLERAEPEANLKTSAEKRVYRSFPPRPEASVKTSEKRVYRSFPPRISPTGTAVVYVQEENEKKYAYSHSNTSRSLGRATDEEAAMCLWIGCLISTLCFWPATLCIGLYGLISHPSKKSKQVKKAAWCNIATFIVCAIVLAIAVTVIVTNLPKTKTEPGGACRTVRYSNGETRTWCD